MWCMFMCDVNVVSAQLLLIGTDTGLFAMQFANDVKHRPMTRVIGIEGTVHAVDGHADHGLAFFVVGMFLLITMQFINVHLLPHLFPLFTFLFLSLALPIFFFCPSIPSLSTRIVPLHFQAGGRRRRPNLG